MNIEKLEGDITSLVADLDEDSFIFDLLVAYGQPKASITRLKKGTLNVAKLENEILWKKKLYFRHEIEDDLHLVIDQARNNSTISKQSPRFLIVTDYETLLAVDARTNETLDIPIKDLPKHFDFFLPWAGMEKSQYKSEAIADIRAAERMGKLYDLILQRNPPETDEDRHALNIFLSRLLFCFFAEDTGIFKDDLFTNSVASHTANDGHDLQAYLTRLFTVLNTENTTKYPKFLQEFPYVNGGLFADEMPVPQFNAKSRDIIIECGALNWKQINPDIFGSMIQAVVHHSMRGSMGIHYTSVVNIMKVIEPLFLNDLKEELEKAGESKTKLNKLLKRLYRIRVFDPACGSGNFLIIAFKELCRLEIEIFKRLQAKAGGQKQLRFESNIQLTQFYGIELDDFAHETAMLSLWLAEHQMNLEFEAVFSEARPTLPLQDGGNIVCGNATQLGWEEVCPADVETYVLGNPPYVGGKSQSTDQKQDMSIVFDGVKNFRQLDYIACWFMRATNYVADLNAECAFVTTSSICQGTQVYQLWPIIFEHGVKIHFAHKPFKWTNNARGNAQVICSIIGLAKQTCEKSVYLYDGYQSRKVDFINAYLATGADIIVYPSLKPISPLPPIITGNSPYDGGHLLLSSIEKKELVAKYPRASAFLLRAYGSKGYLNGHERWCLWISDNQLKAAIAIPDIKSRIEQTKLSRENGGAVAKGLVDRPHQFRYTHRAKICALIIPRHSSERRHCIPVGFLGPDTIILDSAQAIYDPEPWVFAIVSSRIHTCWARILAGRIKTDFRYLSALCYNTFPLPELTEKQKETMEKCVFRVIDQREAHSEKTLAELYDPLKMPATLAKAHAELDKSVDRLFKSKPFSSDDERLDLLFRLYEKMTSTPTVTETCNA